MELVVVFVILLVAMFWIVSAIFTAIFIVPIVLFIAYGQMFGLNWWQSLLAAFVSFAIFTVFIEKYYAWHFRRHAEKLHLSTDVLGQEIEVEGKLVKIIGSSGRKIVVKNRSELFGRRLDYRFVRTKLGLS